MAKKKRTTRRQARPAIMAADHDTKRAYAQFARALLSARDEAEQQARATGQSVPVDIAGATQVLNQYPQLRRYLNAINQREEARLQALGQGEAGMAVSYAAPGTSGFLPDMLRAAPTNSHPQDQGALSFGATKNQPVGVANSRLLREWADSNEWVRSAINIRRIQVGRADILCCPADEGKPYNKSVIKEIQQL